MVQVDRPALHEQISAAYPAWPKQIRRAATFVLDHPEKVALLSMRRQARMAGVPPSTMTRLAKRLGLTGFEALRQVFADDLAERHSEYGERAQDLVDLNQRIGEGALVDTLADNAIRHIRTLCTPENNRAIRRAGHLLSRATAIHCLGLRSSHPVAFQFAHVASYFTPHVHLVDGAGESGMMSVLHDVGAGDAVVVCCLAPYARRTVEILTYLERQGTHIVAITDSSTSPVARQADAVIVVGKSTSSFFDTVTPAFFVGEVLVALLAANADGDIRKRVAETEHKLWGIAEWWRLE